MVYPGFESTESTMARCTRSKGSLPRVLVVLDSSNCSDGSAASTDADMAEINAARAMEVAPLAFARHQIGHLTK